MLLLGWVKHYEHIISMMHSLSSLNADSIPINFLHAIEGTAFENKEPLTPMWCLRIVALARFMLPTKEIRIAGGRELNLRSLQPMALYAANSIFLVTI